MTQELEDKVEKAVKIIRMLAGEDVIEVSYSGGKDSDVLLELVKMSGVKYRAIYKNTTIDPPGTIAHCKSKGVEVLQPKETFLQLIERKGMPTRRARFCCTDLKKYKVLDKAVQGIRCEESRERKERYNPSDPIICRIYGNKANHVNIGLPLLEWTKRDVSEFIKERKIKCHPLYYDEKGVFHEERRLGCIGCPLKGDRGRGDFLKYPKLLRAVIRSLTKWMEKRPDVNSKRKFKSAYGLMAHDLFFNSYEKWKEADETIFGQTDWKDLLQKYFKIDL